MAIPAGHIGRILAQQRLRAADRVLEHMVERMAHVDVAIGVGRAVMKDEFLAPRAGFAQLLVELLLLPAREDTRLLLRQPGLHGEIGLRQEDGISVIARFGHGGGP